MKALVQYIIRSTLKREFSTFVFIYWMIDGTYLMHRMNVGQLAPDAALVAWEGLTPYMFALVTAAYGADYVAKQTNIAGPPTNTETTVKTELTDTSATLTTTSEQKP